MTAPLCPGYADVRYLLECSTRWRLDCLGRRALACACTMLHGFLGPRFHRHRTTKKDPPVLDGHKMQLSKVGGNP